MVSSDPTTVSTAMFCSWTTAPFFWLSWIPSLNTPLIRNPSTWTVPVWSTRYRPRFDDAELIG